MSGHIAVVPVSSVDADAAAAIDYAAGRASHVIAVYLRTGASRGLAVRWRNQMADVPLVIVDVPNGDQAVALRRALAVLERTERPERITLVVPFGDEAYSLAPDSSEGGVLHVERAPSGR